MAVLFAQTVAAACGISAMPTFQVRLLERCPCPCSCAVQLLAELQQGGLPSQEGREGPAGWEAETGREPSHAPRAVKGCPGCSVTWKRRAGDRGGADG